MWLKECTKPMCEDAKYDLKSNVLSHVLSRCLEVCDFLLNYILYCSMLLILSAYQDFFK